tara:strand:- start:34577 stop:35440 length:864 start_codon:yes stop_codon:yes gene_type:complete
MSNTAQTNYMDVLQDIEEFYTDNPVEAWCPTLGKTIKFRPLDVSQMKGIMELQIGAQKDVYGVSAGLQVVNNFNQIIANNCTEDDAKLGYTLTTLDRDAIMLQLRAYSNDTIDIIDDDKTVVVELGKIVDKLKKTRIDDGLMTYSKTYEYKSGNIDVNLGIPSIETDYALNTYFQNVYKDNFETKDAEKVVQDIEKVVSEVFFVEICKYIKSIVINKGDKSTTLNFTDVSLLDDNIAILQKLPSGVISGVSNYINKLKKFRDGPLTYKDASGKNAILAVDANLFIGL